MESLSMLKRANPMPRAGFTDIGYHIYNLNVHIDEVEMTTLNELAKKYTTNPIFNQKLQNKGTDFVNDNKRRTSIPIQNKRVSVIKETMRVVNQYAILVNPRFKVQKAVYLRSEAGCEEQAEHTDGTPTTNDFCSCILAIQEGTKIKMNGRIIYLKVGEAIFFHSEVIHNGCDYKDDNNRLFFYIAEKKNDIPIDGVGDRGPIYCQFCKRLLYYDMDYDHDEVNDAEYELQEKQVTKQKKTLIRNHKRGCSGQNCPKKLKVTLEKSKLARRKSRKNQKRKKLIEDKVDNHYIMDGAALSVCIPVVEETKIIEKTKTIDSMANV